MKLSRIFEARPIYKGETVVLVGAGADNLSALVPKLRKVGPVLCVGSKFNEAPAEVSGFYFGDLRSINHAKLAALDHEADFYATVPQARAYPGWKVFAGRVKGLTFDPGRLCKNGGEHGALINLAAVLGAKRIVLVGFNLLDHTQAAEAGLITQLARWTSHYEIEVIVTDDESAIEAFEWAPLKDFIGTTRKRKKKAPEPVIEEEEQPDD